MSILIVRRGIQGPRGLSGLAARETLVVAANMAAMINVSDHMAELLTLPTESVNVSYDHTISGLSAINVKTAIDELTAAVVANTAAVAVNSLISPIGTVLDYAGVSAPDNYLFCYGQAISRTTYSDLFTAIGVLHGAGNGSTTFNLPDLRGRVVAGQDDMGGTSANRLTGKTGGINGDGLGSTGGAETHTLTTAQLASHNHLNGTCNEIGTTSVYGSTSIGIPGSATWASAGSSSNKQVQGYTSTSGSGQEHNNVQPTLILNKIIRYA